MLELTSADDDETATRADNNSRGRPPSGHPPGHYQAVKPGSPGKRRAQGGASPPASPRLTGPASPRAAAAAAANAARGAESPTEDLSPGKPTGFMSPSYAQKALLLAAMSSTMAFFANGLEHAVATWLPPYGVRHCTCRDICPRYSRRRSPRGFLRMTPDLRLRVISGCISGDLGEEIMAIMTSNFWTTMAAGRLAWVRAENSPRWRRHYIRDVAEICPRLRPTRRLAVLLLRADTLVLARAVREYVAVPWISAALHVALSHATLDRCAIV